MIDFMMWYLSVGCSVYIIFFLEDVFNGFKKFQNADLVSVLIGLSSIIFWPYIIWHMEIK